MGQGDESSSGSILGAEAALIGGLALLILGGFLSMRYLLVLLNRGELSFDSTVIIFGTGLLLIVIGLGLIVRRY